MPLRFITVAYFTAFATIGTPMKYELRPRTRPVIPRARACRVTADPFTGRATERYANAAHCRLAGGASVEAHLAAVAANALPEHMTQLDHLLRCGELSVSVRASVRVRSRARECGACCAFASW